MQWREHLRDWYRFESAIGVSASLEGRQDMQLVHVKRSWEGLSVLNSAQLDDLDALYTYSLDHTGVPVSLLLQGKGVLLKALPKAQLTHHADTDIQQVFPAYNGQDFYAALHHGVDTSWVALVRREPLDNLVNDLLEKGINLVQVCIGPFVLDNILRQLNVYNHIYVFDGHRIETDVEGVWSAYQYHDDHRSQFKTKIGTRHIEQNYLAAYAMAFHTLMDGFVTDFAIQQKDTAMQLDEAQQRIKFRNNGLLLLGGVFLLLLISTLLFSYYHGENEQLESLVGQQQTSGAEVQERGQQSIRYESKLSELGWNGGISKAWLLDQLGSSLDKHVGIQLTGIQINPAPERKRGVKENAVDRRNILIVSGRCVSLDGLNAWVRALNNTDLVRQLHIVKFDRSQVYGDNAHVFQLEIGFGYKVTR